MRRVVVAWLACVAADAALSLVGVPGPRVLTAGLAALAGPVLAPVVLGTRRWGWAVPLVALLVWRALGEVPWSLAGVPVEPWASVVQLGVAALAWRAAPVAGVPARSLGWGGVRAAVVVAVGLVAGALSVDRWLRDSTEGLAGLSLAGPWTGTVTCGADTVVATWTDWPAQPADPDLARVVRALAAVTAADDPVDESWRHMGGFEWWWSDPGARTARLRDEVFVPAAARLDGASTRSSADPWTAGAWVRLRAGRGESCR